MALMVIVKTKSTSGMDLDADKINTGLEAIIRADIPAIFFFSNRIMESLYVNPTVAAPAKRKKILEANALTPKSLNPAKTAQ